MKTDSLPNSNAISEARLAANRANAKFSCGPKTPTGKARSRWNALKHGLTARIAWPGQNARRNQEFFNDAWARLGPRNPLEETCVANLLQSRLQEDLFLDVERTVLTRRPVSLTSDDGNPYTFLHDLGALNALEQLTRHLAHLSRTSEKDLLALLIVRQENWGGRRKSDSPTPPVEELGAPEPDAEGATVPEIEQADDPPVDRGNLEDCLADKRVILPKENSQDFEALARELWATFRPANTMEGFVAGDYIKTQWRLDRVLIIQSALLNRSAVSATGHNSGFGFAFIHDSQRGQAMETLRHYQSVLRKRLGQRMVLWRKLRKMGWTDAILPNTQPPVAPQPPGTPASVPSSGPLLGQEANPDSASQNGATSPPYDS